MVFRSWVAVNGLEITRVHEHGLCILIAAVAVCGYGCSRLPSLWNSYSTFVKLTLFHLIIFSLKLAYTDFKIQLFSPSILIVFIIPSNCDKMLHF